MSAEVENRGRVLLVEDELVTRCLIEDVLIDAGFEVIAVDCPDKAIRVIETELGSLIALVSDINLSPREKSGWDVARYARTRSDTLPVLYMTADSAHKWQSQGVHTSTLIQKPFPGDRLLRDLEQLLLVGEIRSPPQE